MCAIRMHADEIETDAEMVRRLLAGQFPQWAGLRIEPVVSYGTDHDIYRIGEHLAVRLPRIGWATKQAAREAEWLPRLAPHLPLALPVQLAMGHPAEGYPFEWSIYEWLPGENANGTIGDLDQAAVDLAAFVTALRRIDTTGAFPRAPHSRGGPLAESDEQVRRSIAQLGRRIDGAATLRSWQESLDAPEWDGPEVWVHGDLLPGNLLVVDGRLSAVIDFGGLNVGDPACDLQPAWNVFAGDSRLRFRADLDVDDASWLRGRGWALSLSIAPTLPKPRPAAPSPVDNSVSTHLPHGGGLVVSEGAVQQGRDRPINQLRTTGWRLCIDGDRFHGIRVVAQMPRIGW